MKIIQSLQSWSADEHCFFYSIIKNHTKSYIFLILLMMLLSLDQSGLYTKRLWARYPVLNLDCWITELMQVPRATCSEKKEQYKYFIKTLSSLQSKQFAVQSLSNLQFKQFVICIELTCCLFPWSSSASSAAPSLPSCSPFTGPHLSVPRRLRKPPRVPIVYAGPPRRSRGFSQVSRRLQHLPVSLGVARE